MSGATRPLALAAGSMLDQPAVVLIEAAAAVGFGAVGLRLSGEHAVAAPELLGDIARGLGVAIHDSEVYRVTVEAADPTPLLEASAAAGASRVLVVSDLADRSATVAAVGELVERAGALDLTVGLEYMAWTDPSDPLGTIEVARQTGCVVVVDLLHHVRVGAGGAELDAIVASGTLGWVQLCDAAGPAPRDLDALVHEARHRRLVAGAGDLPLRVLLQHVPDGVTVSVEVQSDALRLVPPLDRAGVLFATSSATLAQGPSSTG